MSISKKLTAAQTLCLMALYGTSPLHGMLAWEVGLECGQIDSKANAWARPKLSSLVQKGYVKEYNRGYRITAKGEAHVDNIMAGA